MMSSHRTKVQRFLVWSADITKLETIKILRSYLTGPFDNVDLHMFGNKYQDIFSAVACLRARVTFPKGGVKKRACFCFGESARGA